MTTDYERGRIAGIEAAAGIFDGEAAAMRADELDIAATIFEKHAELVRALLPPASNGAGGEPGPTVTTWRLAVEGLLHEWDKLTRHGSPMAKNANEAVAYARKLMAMPYPSPTTAEPGACPKCGAAPDERWDCCEVHALMATTPEPRGCPTVGADVETYSERDIEMMARGMASWSNVYWTSRNVPFHEMPEDERAQFIQQARDLAADAQQGE